MSYGTAGSGADNRVVFHDSESSRESVSDSHGPFEAGAALVALYNFAPEHDDEAAFARGDELFAVADMDEHWVKVSNVATGRVGIAPKSYVAPRQREKIVRFGQPQFLDEQTGNGARHSSDSMSASQLFLEGPQGDRVAIRDVSLSGYLSLAKGELVELLSHSTDSEVWTVRRVATGDAGKVPRYATVPAYVLFAEDGQRRRGTITDLAQADAVNVPGCTLPIRRGEELHLIQNCGDGTVVVESGAHSGTVPLSIIPHNALERLEILRKGVSSGGPRVGRDDARRGGDRRDNGRRDGGGEAGARRDTGRRDTGRRDGGGEAGARRDTGSGDTGSRDTGRRDDGSGWNHRESSARPKSLEDESKEDKWNSPSSDRNTRANEGGAQERVGPNSSGRRGQPNGKSSNTRDDTGGWQEPTRSHASAHPASHAAPPSRDSPSSARTTARHGGSESTRDSSRAPARTSVEPGRVEPGSQDMLRSRAERTSPFSSSPPSRAVHTASPPPRATHDSPPRLQASPSRRYQSPSSTRAPGQQSPPALNTPRAGSDVQGCRGRVLTTYDSRGPDELTVEGGATVYVIKQLLDDEARAWYRVVSHHVVGIVPAENVEVDYASSHPNVARVDFVARDDTQITLMEGATVYIVEDNGKTPMVRGICRGRVGLFPRECVSAVAHHTASPRYSRSPPPSAIRRSPQQWAVAERAPRQVHFQQQEALPARADETRARARDADAERDSHDRIERAEAPARAYSQYAPQVESPSERTDRGGPHDVEASNERPYRDGPQNVEASSERSFPSAHEEETFREGTGRGGPIGSGTTFQLRGSQEVTPSNTGIRQSPGRRRASFEPSALSSYDSILRLVGDHRGAAAGETYGQLIRVASVYLDQHRDVMRRTRSDRTKGEASYDLAVCAQRVGIAMKKLALDAGNPAEVVVLCEGVVAEQASYRTQTLSALNSLILAQDTRTRAKDLVRACADAAIWLTSSGLELSDNPRNVELKRAHVVAIAHYAPVMKLAALDAVHWTTFVDELQSGRDSIVDGNDCVVRLSPHASRAVPRGRSSGSSPRAAPQAAPLSLVHQARPGDSTTLDSLGRAARPSPPQDEAAHPETRDPAQVEAAVPRNEAAPAPRAAEPEANREATSMPTQKSQTFAGSAVLLYDFAAQGSREMSCRKGERVMFHHEQPFLFKGWTHVQSLQSEDGLVPSDFLSPKAPPSTGKKSSSKESKGYRPVTDEDVRTSLETSDGKVSFHSLANFHDRSESKIPLLASAKISAAVEHVCHDAMMLIELHLPQQNERLPLVARSLCNSTDFLWNLCKDTYAEARAAGQQVSPWTRSQDMGMATDALLEASERHTAAPEPRTACKLTLCSERFTALCEDLLLDVAYVDRYLSSSSEPRKKKGCMVL